MADTNLQVRIGLEDNISSELKKIESNFGSFNSTLNNKIKNVGKSIEGLGSKMTILATTPIFTGGGFSLKAFSDLNEAINATNVVFGESSNKLIDFSKESAKAAGLSKRAFLQAGIPIGSLLQNVGLSADESAGKTIELTKRASDLASVFNTDLDSAITAIQAGLRGEADPLERFGVGLSEANVKAYALSNGIIEVGKEMTAQQKVTARLGLFFEQTNKVQGDFVNTSDQFANKTRILRAEIENQAVSIGEKLMPIISKVLELVIKAIEYWNGLSEANKDLAIKIAVIVAVIGPLLVVLSQIIIAVTTLAPIFAFLGGVIAGLSVPVLIVIGVIGALIAIGVLLWKNWDWVSQKARELGAILSGVWANIGDKAQWVKDKFNQLKDSVFGLIGALGNIRMPEALTNIWDRMKSIGNIPGLGALFGRKAIGGIAMGGQYLVGETGPEMVTLPQGSRVTRSSETRDMLQSTKQGVTQNNYITMNNSVDWEIGTSILARKLRLS